MTAAPAQEDGDLSATEIAALTWQEKIQLAGGYLSPQKARACIQARQYASLTPTEKVLRAKGCKTLAELPSKRVVNPLD